jgi:hypothetical protein
MIGFKLKPTRDAFFDLTAVRTPVDRASRRVLKGFGAFVRRAAKSSVRKRKKASEPGKPPSSHSGFLKRLIVFCYEAAFQNVVIGPLLFGRKVQDGKPVGRMTVPEVLEYGGSVTLLEYQRDYTASGRAQVIAMGKDPDAWHRLGRKRIWHKKGQPLRIRAQRRRTINIAPRPLMRLAFEAERPKLRGMWANSIKR